MQGGVGAAKEGRREGESVDECVMGVWGRVRSRRLGLRHSGGGTASGWRK